MSNEQQIKLVSEAIERASGGEPLSDVIVAIGERVQFSDCEDFVYFMRAAKSAWDDRYAARALASYRPGCRPVARAGSIGRV